MLKETNRFSAGVVHWHSGECIKDIFDRADHGMYQVKESNKNGIMFCDQNSICVHVVKVRFSTINGEN